MCLSVFCCCCDSVLDVCFFVCLLGSFGVSESLCLSVCLSVCVCVRVRVSVCVSLSLRVRVCCYKQPKQSKKHKKRARVFVVAAASCLL